MDNNYTHVTVVLDSSGSMSDRKDETVQAYNELLNGQRNVPGKMTYSLYLFNRNVYPMRHFVDLNSIDNLSVSEYIPASTTALNDAICRAIDETGLALSKMREFERPSKVILVIITDGFENSSSMFTEKQRDKKIRHQREVYNWEVMFIGCDEHQVKEYENLWGLPPHAAVYTAVNALGQTLRGDVSAYVTRCRTTGDNAQ